MEDAIRLRLYTLSLSDIKIIRERRGSTNRLCFAAQLCAMRYPGITLGNETSPPCWLLDYLVEQLALSVENGSDRWKEYLERKYKRREHIQDIQSLFGFTSFGRSHVRAALEGIQSVAFHSDKGIIVAQALVENLRQQRILLPPLPVLERLCAQAMTQAERRIYSRLCQLLTQVQQQKLEEFLNIVPGTKITRLRWLCQSPVAANPKQILEHIERLQTISTLNLPSEIGKDVPTHRLTKLARQGTQMTVPDLARFESKRRLATLVAVICETRATIIDETIELHDRMMGAAFNRAKRTQEQQWGEVGKAVNEKVRLYAQIGQSLLQAREEGGDAFAAIESVLSWEQFSQSVQAAKQLARPVEFDTLSGLIESYTTIRRYSPAWLEALSFTASPTSRDLMVAVELLRKMNRQAGVSREKGRDCTLRVLVTCRGMEWPIEVAKKWVAK